MRRIQELFMINDKGMSLVLLIIITVSIPTINRKTMYYNGFPCVYDFYINTSLYIVITFLVPLILFYILYVERYNFSAVVVVRKKNKMDIWSGCVKELAAMSLISAIYVYIITTISGLLMTHTMYNWNQETSRCYNSIGKISDMHPSALLLGVIFTFQIFCIIFIMGILMLAMWWISDRKIYGYLFAFVIILIEYYDKFDKVSKGILWRRTVISYILYKKELDVCRYIIIPLVMLFCTVILTSAAVRFKKKEFI